MTEKDTKSASKIAEQTNAATAKHSDIKKFTEVFKSRNVSSDELISIEKNATETLKQAKNDRAISAVKLDDAQSDEAVLSEKEIDFLTEKSPIFKQLSEPTLPELPRENRARLQMQSPTRIYLYWSTAESPFQTLRRIFGAAAGDYALVARIVNETRNRQQTVLISAEGSWWFEVDANSVYRADIGFYAAHRPFVRLMFSNTIETPRSNPSPRGDFSVDWAISANQFARVLDSSGYAQDAVEVALAGDDFKFAETATKTAFAQMIGAPEIEFPQDYAGEIRFILLALAAGRSPESLRGQISANLFALLLENAANLSAENALKALEENFGEFADQPLEENFGEMVFGASAINFPRFSRRKNFPKFPLVSSSR